jgi:imidazolonepropionase-like amidohydrolase
MFLIIKEIRIMKNIITYIIIVFTIFNTYGQRVEKSKSGNFLLRGATIHTVTKGDIIGDIFISNGMISEIGVSISPTGQFTTLDCKGKHIYPGLIDGGTQLGLSEIEAVSITNDYADIGDFIPQMQALTAVNPNAVAIPVTRANGVTSVIASPAGGRFPGTAALIDLHGYTPEQMYAGFKGKVMNFPSTGRRGRWDRRSDEDVKKDAEKAAKRLDDLWEAMSLYAKIDSAATAEGKKIETHQPDMAAMLNVVRGKEILLIEVNKDDDIKAALKWLEGKNLKVVLTGVAEGFRVAKEIAKAKVPVIVAASTELPRRDYDRYDSQYSNASILQKAGVKIALKSDESENVRNLPFMAGFAAAYGLGVDQALKAVTINAAEILGVADKYGSIEKGKIANLILTTGDPFETKTQIEKVFIRGWDVPTESRQTLLYNEFLSRDPSSK